MKFHVLRIPSDEATTIEDVRAGDEVDAQNANAAADIWLADRRRAMSFSEHDHFNLVVMDPRGDFIHLDVSMRVSPVVKL